MSTRRAPRLAHLGWEVLGVLLASALGLVAVAHALSGAKRSLLLDDGDSVLLPLMVRSFERGEPFEWGMSPVLFVFPELPLYLVSALLTASVAAALLLNAVLNVVLLYALLRFVAGRVLATRRFAEVVAPTGPAVPDTRESSEATDRAPTTTAAPPRAIVAALVGTAVFVVFCLLESRPGGNTGEIASLFLTTTYYAGTVMALLGVLGLVLHLAGPLDGRGRRILLPGLAIGLIAAASTLSNPLFVLWVAGPLVAALAVLSILRWRSRIRDPWWRPAVSALALVAGSGVGYLARHPLQRFIIADKNEYFRWGLEDTSLRFAVDTVRQLVATPGGVVEASVAGALLIASLIAAVAVVARRRTGPVALAALFAGWTVITVPPVLLITGSISTRYAVPLVFTPLVLLVIGVATRPLARRIIATASVTLAVVVVGFAIPSSVAVARVADGPGDTSATCLTDWTRGKHVAGVAQFWTGRGLQAYGGSSVDLLQVNADLSVYPWLVNLAAYKNARVGYVVVAIGGDSAGHLDYWGETLTDLGAPRDIVDCGRYEIYDFRGLPAAAAITARVEHSAEVQAAFRGFGW